MKPGQYDTEIESVKATGGVVEVTYRVVGGEHHGDAIKQELQQEPLFPIKLIEFVRPYGKRQERILMRPREIYDAAQVIEARGWSLHVEQLATGEISITISDDEEGQDELIRIGRPMSKEQFAVEVDALILDGAALIDAMFCVRVEHGAVQFDLVESDVWLMPSAGPQSDPLDRSPAVSLVAPSAVNWIRTLRAYADAIERCVSEIEDPVDE